MHPDLKEVEVRSAKLTALFRDADAQLQTLIAPVLASSGATGRQKSTVLGQSYRLLRLLATKSSPQAGAMVKMAYVRSARTVHQDYKMTYTADQIVATFNDQLNHQLRGALDTVYRNLNIVFSRLSVAALSVEAIRRQRVDNPNIEALNMEALVALRDARDRRWGLEQYAHMAITTIGAEAATNGVLSAMAEQGYDLVVLSRTPQPSIKCQPWDGGTFSISGTHPTHPMLTRLPPFHPECDHYLTAVS